MNISTKERTRQESGSDFMIVEAKNKKPSLKVIAGDGSIKTFHSLYDPEAEAKNIIN